MRNESRGLRNYAVVLELSRKDPLQEGLFANIDFPFSHHLERALNSFHLIGITLAFKIQDVLKQPGPSNDPKKLFYGN